MVARDYDEALRLVLKYEGGYTNHPSDPGGPTNWGITIADARKYWKPNANAADVKAMPLSVAKSIYKARYWNVLCCDALPPGVDYSIMDYGVNSGVGRAGKVLRRLLHLPDNTSVINQQVIDAANKANVQNLILAINSERLAFLKSLKTWPVFGKGWGARVAAVKANSLFMAGKTVVVAPEPSKDDVRAKGQVPVNKSAQHGGAGSVIISGSATASTQTHNPWLVVAIIAASVAVAVGIYFFFKWRQKKAQEAPVPFIMQQEAVT